MVAYKGFHNTVVFCGAGVSGDEKDIHICKRLLETFDHCEIILGQFYLRDYCIVSFHKSC